MTVWTVGQPREGWLARVRADARTIAHHYHRLAFLVLTGRDLDKD